MPFCAMDIHGYVQWFPILSLLFVIIWLGISLVYMISRLANKPEGEAWAKTEFYSSIVSFLLVFFMFGISEVFCMTSLELAGGKDPFQASSEYVTKFSNNLIPSEVAFLWQVAKDVRKSVFKTMLYPSCIVGGCVAWDAGNTYIVDNIELVNYFSIPFAAGLVAQKLALMFIEEAVFTMIIPAGFILKLFPYTRSAGAYLISMGFAFYFVFPMFYVLGTLVYTETKGAVSEIEGVIRAVGPSEYLHFDNSEEAFLSITRLAMYV
ncbi:MAG: hypothetical protein ACPL0A_03655, partial [Candidatus Micrarchaeia archaeon]